MADVVHAVEERYRELGYVLVPTNPREKERTGISAYRLRNVESGKRLSTGGAFHESDVALFVKISEKLNARSVFIIGNAFGYSTFCLSEIFKEAIVDVIDAETEGSDNVLGSELTRRIAKEHYPRVRLTIGYSPQDTPRAVSPAITRELGGYDVVFVDGLHTDEQQVKDFRGLVPFLSEKCVVVFHDVGYFHMRESFRAITREARALGFDTFIETETSTVFGVGVMGRGVDSLGEYLGSFPSFVDRRIWDGAAVEAAMLNEWFWYLDNDKDGTLSRDEYLRERLQADNWARAYERMLERADEDADGALALAECRRAFAALISEADARNEFRKLDRNGDGAVELEEFARHPFAQMGKKLERDFRLLGELGDLGEDERLSLSGYLRVFAGIAVREEDASRLEKQG